MRKSYRSWLFVVPSAARASRDSIALRFGQFAPAPVWKKLLKAAKLIWKSWSSL